MTIEFSSYAHATIVVVIILIIAAWGVFFLKFKEKLRIKRLQKKDISEAVETDILDEVDSKSIKSRGTSSIHERFKYLRRIYLVFLVILGGVILMMPYLETIPRAYVSLIAGAATVVVGFAAKPFIENLIGGLVVTMAQPIQVGDTVVIRDHYGTVEKIDLLYSVVKVWNWRRYTIPNSQLLQLEVQNLTLFDELEWATVEFWVAPNSDIDQVEKLAIEAMKSSSFLADYEEPAFWVMELGQQGIHCWVAGWAQGPSRSWSLKSEARKELIRLFRRNSISFQTQKVDLTSTLPTERSGV